MLTPRELAVEEGEQQMARGLGLAGGHHEIDAVAGRDQDRLLDLVGAMTSFCRAGPGSG